MKISILSKIDAGEDKNNLFMDCPEQCDELKGRTYSLSLSKAMRVALVALIPAENIPIEDDQNENLG